MITPSELLQFEQDVIAGLSEPPRRIPSKYFYDRRGSALFDQICDLEEYYPTRAEMEIMELNAVEMASRIGAQARLVEYGSGSSLKTRSLLDHLEELTQYIPIDISSEHLAATVADLAAAYPELDIQAVAADFTQALDLPNCQSADNRTCVYFPGSTIGNFTMSDAVALLRKINRETSPQDGLLVGVDLRKDRQVLEAAYNDRLGVTARFNLNLLHRINVELGGNFDCNQYQHLAVYNEDHDRIEMNIVSQCEQVVAIGEHRFVIGDGEAICTEYSHKYSVDSFTDLASLAGWERRDVWTDSRDYFAVIYLEREPGKP